MITSVKWDSLSHIQVIAIFERNDSYITILIRKRFYNLGEEYKIVCREFTLEDFARYTYLPRLKDSSVLLNAIQDGVSLLTWEQDSFALAESCDETAERYRGERCGQVLSLFDAASTNLLVKGAIARKQIDQEKIEVPTPTPLPPDRELEPPVVGREPPVAPVDQKPKRFHGTVTLDSAWVGRDASKVDEK